MSASNQYLLGARGERHEFEGYVVGAAWSGDIAAFALGDGTVHVGTACAAAHEGAVLAIATAGDGFITGGDDGVFCHVSRDGAVRRIASFGMKWVEHVAAHGGLVGCSVGKTVHVWEGDDKLKALDHPSTVTGLTFDAKGKRIAASHYNGATLWFSGAKVDSPRRLEWKGSHIGVAIHPHGDAVVTAMQENSLHGWRLADGQHMRMSGYPAKTESMGFTRSGRWLASAGADTIVLWPFFGGGPMGKAPTELAGGDNVLCSVVACHPRTEMIAAGFTDGLVLLADIPSARILPIAPPGHGRVTALAWNDEGARLAFGTETGFAASIDLSRR